MRDTGQAKGQREQGARRRPKSRDSINQQKGHTMEKEKLIQMIVDLLEGIDDIQTLEKIQGLINHFFVRQQG